MVGVQVPMGEVSPEVGKWARGCEHLQFCMRKDLSLPDYFHQIVIVQLGPSNYVVFLLGPWNKRFWVSGRHKL